MASKRGCTICRFGLDPYTPEYVSECLKTLQNLDSKIQSFSTLLPKSNFSLMPTTYDIKQIIFGIALSDRAVDMNKVQLCYLSPNYFLSVWICFLLATKWQFTTVIVSDQSKYLPSKLRHSDFEPQFCRLFYSGSHLAVIHQKLFRAWHRKDKRLQAKG